MFTNFARMGGGEHCGRLVGAGMVIVAGAAIGVSAIGMGRAFPPPPPPPPPHENDLQAYAQHNLVADDASQGADHVDADLVNPWGITPNPTGVWWVSDNGTGVSTLYDSAGNKQTLRVTIPRPAGDTDPAKVNGIVFNADSSAFHVSSGSASGSAAFIFATEDGIIAGWAPAVPAPPPSTHAQVGVDSSKDGAIYKGLALVPASGSRGARLYATDFHNGRVDVFDASFAPVPLGAHAFQDPHVDRHFAPFGIQNIDGNVFVTFAKQDANAEDNLDGHGLGFVDVFDPDGVLISRFAEHGKLNAPWAVVKAPADFGKFSNDILIGNFGDGRITAFDADGHERGQLRDPDNHVISIDGLWGLSFGNNGQAGPRNVLFFAAGPSDESHGLFGSLTAAAREHGHGHDDGDGDADDGG